MTVQMHSHVNSLQSSHQLPTANLKNKTKNTFCHVFVRWDVISLHHLCSTPRISIPSNIQWAQCAAFHYYRARLSLHVVTDIALLNTEVIDFYKSKKPEEFIEDIHLK